MLKAILLGCGFILGAILESILLLNLQLNKAEKQKYAMALIIPTVVTGVVVIANLIEKEPWQTTVVLFMCIFLCSFAVLFKHRLLKPIDERSVVIMNCVFLYVYLQHHVTYWVITLLVSSISISVLVNALISRNVHSVWRFFLYVWFLVMIIYIAAVQLQESDFSFVSASALQFDNDATFIATIISGMAVAYIIVYCWYVFWLIPIPGKHQKLSARLVEWREDIALMTSRYDTKEFHWIINVVSIIVVSGTLYLNYAYHITNDWVIVSICIAGVQAVSLIGMRITEPKN